MSELQILMDSMIFNVPSFTVNGGSASDCNHLATELVSKFYKERKGFCAISLALRNSTITEIGNNYGYDRVFARQVEALGDSDMITGKNVDCETILIKKY